jgi:type IV pilus assembly protein PilB
MAVRGRYDGNEAERGRELAQRYGCEFVNLEGFRIDPELLKTVPVELMFRYNFVPLEETIEGRLAVAIADPSQLLMIDEISLLLGKHVVTRVSSLKQISVVLERTQQSHGEKYE